MDASKFYTVIVDDTMRKDDPFVVELQLNYADVANIEFFSSVDKAMSFVEQHMSKRMIIFMDCKFGSVWQGVDAIKDLRKQTSLIYVVMMSANNVNQLDPSDIAALINMDNIFFIKNTDTDGAIDYVNRIRILWKSRFDCILEHWLVRHPEDADKVAFTEVSGKTYTWEEILSELRLQTPAGKAMEQVVNEYYLYEFTTE